MAKAFGKRRKPREAEISKAAKEFHSEERGWNSAKYRLAASILELWKTLDYVYDRPDRFQVEDPREDFPTPPARRKDLLLDLVRLYVTEDERVAGIWADAIAFAYYDLGIPPKDLPRFFHENGGLPDCAADWQTIKA